MRQWHKFILILFSAFLISFSFAPFYIWIFSFLCFVPIFFLIDFAKLRVKEGLLYGFLLGFIINLISYHWINHTVMVFGHLPFFLSSIIFVLYSLGTTLRYAFFIGFAIYLQGKLPVSGRLSFLSSRWFLYPFLFTFFEFFTWQLFPYYGGNLLGGNLYLIQSADIWGVRGLSIFWFLMNLGVYELLLKFMESLAKKPGAYKGKFFSIINNFISFLKERDIHKRAESASYKKIIAIVLLLVFSFIYGFIRQQQYKIHSNDKTITVAVPQGHTPLSFQAFRSAEDQNRENVNNMVNQSLRLLEKESLHGKPIDVLLWPESAVPFLRLRNSALLQGAVSRILSQQPMPFILNDIININGKSYSNMWFISSKGELLENYQKVFLLPFGEFMPLGNTFPFLKRVVPEISDFSHGTRQVTFSHKKAEIMPLICYEVIIPEYVRSMHKATNFKSQLIVNITNDTWFGNSIESGQHLELGRMRAIEHRIPIVRATNSGISAAILPDGQIIGKTPLFSKANATYTVPIRKSQSTFYAQWGDLWLYLFLGIGFLFLFYGFLISNQFRDKR